jgi:hypothetical protein
MDLIKTLESLVKTLEAGNYNAAPSMLVQGSALQIEDLSPVMHNVCWDDSHIKLQKLFSVKKAKSLLVQFNRQLSYGRFGSSARREGFVGDVQVGDYIRAVVPMCFYSHVRRVTIAANMVEAFDGEKAEDREADNAAMLIAGDIEFDSFKGKADFSNAGVFDGNPLAIPELPNMLGLDVQVRQSDALLNTQDLMFASFGANKSVVLSKNGALDQPIVEDSAVRSRMNHGKAELMLVDPEALSAYNKSVALGTGANSIKRIVLAGSAQDASGADLRRQWVSQGTVTLEDSRFLSGKTAPLRPSIGSPAAPGITTQPAAAGADGIIPAGSYRYLITGENERGESSGTLSNSVTVLATNHVTIVITAQAGVSYFNVYRALGASATASQCRYIGRVAQAASGNTTFTDLGNKIQAFVTGYLIQKDTWGFHELAPYSRLKLAISDLSLPEAHFRFASLCGYQPRKNVIVDNLTGSGS